MNLQDFIKETITQIAESVIGIQEHFDEKGIDAIVNPREFQDIKDADFAGRYKPVSSHTGNPTNYFRLVDAVEFDVAVTVETDSTKGVGGKLKIMDIGIGADGSQTDKLANISKVKFKIPLVLPHGRENKD